MPITYAGGSAPPPVAPLPTPSLARVLLYLVPGARFSYDEEVGYASVVWEGPGTKPTQAEVDAARDAATAALQAPYVNESTLRQQADAALVDLRAYRDLASPTNAQTVAAVKLLCRVCIGLIRLALRKLDSTT
jgi:hypothetical protein